MCGKTGKAFGWSRERSGRRRSGKRRSCSDEMSDLRLTLTKTCMDLTFDDHSVLKRDPFPTASSARASVEEW
ncbi:unnamed protein product [Coccothraustes coccothraustes]